MNVFLDFEASSLAKAGYPIEVAWVFEDGRSESHLIRPAAEWTDWDAEAEAIHHIDRDTLRRDGTPPGDVARRMVDALTGHDLFATAPSWDGKWLSALLRVSGYPRHTLRLRDTDEAQIEVARSILRPVVPPAALDDVVENVIVLSEVRAHDGPPAHRALADAQVERERWLTVAAAARAEAARRGGGSDRPAERSPG